MAPNKLLIPTVSLLTLFFLSSFFPFAARVVMVTALARGTTPQVKSDSQPLGLQTQISRKELSGNFCVLFKLT